jgi:hypothetical protein
VGVKSCDGDFGGDGVGEEAFLVGDFVDLGELFFGGEAIAGELDFGVEGDAGDGEFSFGTGFEVTDGTIGVAFDGKAFFAGDGEEGEHVAGGEGGDEGAFGIDAVGIAEEFLGGGGAEGVAVFESPVMVPGVGLVGEIGVGISFPGEGGLVFGHG